MGGSWKRYQSQLRAVRADWCGSFAARYMTLFELRLEFVLNLLLFDRSSDTEAFGGDGNRLRNGY